MMNLRGREITFIVSQRCTVVHFEWSFRDKGQETFFYAKVVLGTVGLDPGPWPFNPVCILFLVGLKATLFKDLHISFEPTKEILGHIIHIQFLTFGFM